MSRTQRDYLQDMLLYIARIEETTRDGKEAFEKSYVIQDAVIRQYEVIGEIAKRLPSEVLTQQTTVQWKNIIGFRDFLAHNYYRVDLRVVWDAVDQLSTLRQAVEALLANLPDEPDDDAAE